MAWFEHADVRIYFEDEGTGEPLLFMPGWSDSVEGHAHLRAALAGKFRVIAADLPGSGKSQPQPRQYRATYYHDDARSFLALIKQLGIAPAHVVGFSDGGEVALVMAVLDPQSIRSLAVWGAAGQMAAPDEMLDAFVNVVDDPIEPLKDFSGYLRAAYGEANARAMTHNFIEAMRGIKAAGGDIMRSRAAEISAPALLITGEQDFFAPPPVVSELAKAVPGGEFVEVAGAGHDLHHSHGDWLAETLMSWLSRTTAPA